MDSKNNLLLLIIGIGLLITPFRQLLCMNIEEKCKIVKSILQRYQTQCVFLLKPQEQKDMEWELVSYKYFKDFSGNFYISSMIHEKWMTPRSRGTCQPFVFAFHKINQVDTMLNIFTGSTYRANTKWLLFEDLIRNENDFFNNSYISLDTEFLLAQRLPYSEEIVINELYHVVADTPLRTQAVGRWNPNSGLNWTTKSYSQRRNNFYGAELKAAFIPIGKMLIILEQKDDKPIKIGGLAFQIWDELQNALNFTTNYKRVAHGGSGVQDANGSWNGMIDMLRKKVVDIGLLTLTMSVSRLRVIDYFLPAKKSSLVIYIKRDESKESALYQILKPLSQNLWIAVGIFQFILSGLLTVSWFFTEKIYHQNSAIKCTIINSIFYVFGIFCQKDPGIPPNTWPTRIVFFIGSMFALIVYVAYSAMLFSFLAVIKYEIPIEDLKELTDDGRYTLGLLQNSANFMYFRTSKEPVIMEAYRKLVLAEKNHPTKMEEGLRRICQRERYAFMGKRLFEKHIRPDLDLTCDYFALPSFFLPVSLALACAKNSPFKRLINYHTIRMAEGGLLKILYERLEPLKFRGNIQEEQSTVVTLEKVAVIFIIYITGVISSIVLLIIEIIYHRFKVTSQLNFVN